MTDKDEGRGDPPAIFTFNAGGSTSSRPGTSRSASSTLAESSARRDSYDDFGGDTKSVTSSIAEGVMDGGRRYHAYRAGRYPFPNDAEEQERDELKHELMLMLLGKNFVAPVEESSGVEEDKRVGLLDNAMVLDLGTGNGRWCIEMGDKYPNSTFVGVDLSPIQPSLVPPNVSFLVDDFEDEDGWDFPDAHFDYIHLRHCLFSVRDRKGLYERIHKHLKPGGCVEVQEFSYHPASDDDSLSAETPYRVRDFFNLLGDGLKALGLSVDSILSAGDEMHAAGLFGDKERRAQSQQPQKQTQQTQQQQQQQQQQQHRSWSAQPPPSLPNVTTKKVPIGPWGKNDEQNSKECGQFLKTILLDGLVAVSRKPFGQGLNWSRVQIEMFLVEVRAALNDVRFHTYLPLYTVVAYKPLLNPQVSSIREGQLGRVPRGRQPR